VDDSACIIAAMVYDALSAAIGSPADLSLPPTQYRRSFAVSSVAI
jgi:hypothetical protein